MPCLGHKAVAAAPPPLPDPTPVAASPIATPAPIADPAPIAAAPLAATPAAPLTPPAVPVSPPPAPQLPDSAVQNAGAAARAKAAAASGAMQTIINVGGPAGLTAPATTTATKTKLGA